MRGLQLVAQPTLAKVVDRGQASRPERLDGVQRLPPRFVSQPGHETVDLRLRLRQQSVLAQQFREYHIAHPESEGGHIDPGNHLEQIVVAAAAANRPQLAARVPQLEDDAGVVGQPAHDRKIDIHIVPYTQVVQVLKVGGELGDRLADALHAAEFRLQSIDAAQLGGREDATDRPRFQPQVPETPRQGLARLPVQLVYHLVNRLEGRLGHAEMSEDGA